MLRFPLRGHRINLNGDFAVIYGVELCALRRQRDSERFSDDFMFVLTPEDNENLKSQNVISSWGGARGIPMAVTGRAVAMRSSVGRSEHAGQTPSKQSPCSERIGVVNGALRLA
jgi:ORF6N domain